MLEAHPLIKPLPRTFAEPAKGKGKGRCLTESWEDLQRGEAQDTLIKLLQIFNVLELDKKARVDLMLLYNRGIAGRTCANKLLWELLSDWAMEPSYEGLSRKVSSEALWLRTTFDRPQMTTQTSGGGPGWPTRCLGNDLGDGIPGLSLYEDLEEHL